MLAYTSNGFQITSQTDQSALLVIPKKFDWLGFILLLLLFWPGVIIQIIVFAAQKEKSVSLRVAPDGRVEATGYTLETLERDKKRQRTANIVAAIIIALLVIVICILASSSSSSYGSYGMIVAAASVLQSCPRRHHYCRKAYTLAPSKPDLAP